MSLVLVLESGYHRIDHATYLVSNHGLLDGSEVLERRKEDMTPLRAADIFDKATEFFAQSDEHLVLILHGF
jgi:hypothetical protein